VSNGTVVLALEVRRGRVSEGGSRHRAVAAGRRPKRWLGLLPYPALKTFDITETNDIQQERRQMRDTFIASVHDNGQCREFSVHQELPFSGIRVAY
jgi:hypothetical protein